jgi:hypothetical protein
MPAATVDALQAGSFGARRPACPAISGGRPVQRIGMIGPRLPSVPGLGYLLRAAIQPGDAIAAANAEE